MTSITPIENKDAEQAVIKIVASKLRAARIAEIKAWTAYTDTTQERTPERVEELRNIWIFANGRLMMANNIANSVCAQIGAGWRELDEAFNNAMAHQEE